MRILPPLLTRTIILIDNLLIKLNFIFRDDIVRFIYNIAIIRIIYKYTYIIL